MLFLYGGRSQKLAQPILREPPATTEAAIEIALRTRPDLRMARLLEEAAQAVHLDIVARVKGAVAQPT